MAELGAITEREIALIGRFIERLKEEQEALCRADPEPLAAIGAAKIALVDELNALEQERRALLGVGSEQKTRAAMNDWLAANPGQKLAAMNWQKLLELAQEAKTLHGLNAGLIAVHLQQTGDALHALDSRRAADALYGNDGQATPTSGSRLVDSA